MLMNESKPLLRAEMKKRRTALAVANPVAGESVAKHAVDALDVSGWPAKPAIVAGYWPIQSEISPFPLMEAFADRGYALALPCLVADGDSFRMVFRRFRIGDRLITGPFDILQPDEGPEEVNPDIVLMPLLAFTASGQRLGYGGGYYDRAVSALRGQKAIQAIGIAFSAQQLAEIPFEVHDQQLDGIFTDQGAIEARPH